MAAQLGVAQLGTLQLGGAGGAAAPDLNVSAFTGVWPGGVVIEEWGVPQDLNVTAFRGTGFRAGWVVAQVWDAPRNAVYPISDRIVVQEVMTWPEPAALWPDRWDIGVYTRDAEFTAGQFRFVPVHLVFTGAPNNFAY